MRRIVQRVVLVVALSAPFWMLGARDAGATAGYESPYTYEQTYSAGLRLLRVDLGFKITEKDPDSGYLLFEYSSPESGKRVHAGAMELVRLEDKVLVTVKLPTMPQYHERVIIEALSGKLSAEYGDPPKRNKPEPADAGVEGG